jgi:hypothetical protein
VHRRPAAQWLRDGRLGWKQSRTATDRRYLLSSHWTPFRKPSRLIAATVSHLVSVAPQILFRSRAKITGLAVGTAVVAAISLGTALLWPASAAPNAGAAVPRAQTITGAAAAVATIDSGLDVRRARTAALIAHDQAVRVALVKLQARKAAERRAAAARAAAEQLAQQQAANAQAAQSSSSGSGSSGSGSSGSGSSSTSPQPSGSPQQIASAMLSSFGWGQDQFGCLVSLWNTESGWNVSASNPSTGAYGIPQALPGSKMASAGPDWQTNAATQIRWGLGYIQGLYGSPCGAWGHEQSTGWY